MKDTGIIRKVDDLGRVVIPMELRRSLGIKVKDPLEIYVEDGRIILGKLKADPNVALLEAAKSLLSDVAFEGVLKSDDTALDELQSAVTLVENREA